MFKSSTVPVGRVGDLSELVTTGADSGRALKPSRSLKAKRRSDSSSREHSSMLSAVQRSGNPITHRLDILFGDFVRCGDLLLRRTRKSSILSSLPTSNCRSDGLLHEWLIRVQL